MGVVVWVGGGGGQCLLYNGSILVTSWLLVTYCWWLVENVVLAGISVFCEIPENMAFSLSCRIIKFWQCYNLFNTHYDRVRSLFQKQFSRPFPGLLQDSDRFFQVSQMHNNWSNRPLRNVNPKIILQKILFKENFPIRVCRFPGLSRTCINFPGLSSPGKCQNKIPGLPRISRTWANPAKSRCWQD